ncbi:MAG: hypothetical protein ACJ8H8_32330, partial [Geminicoccaceae bacterium]
TPVFSGASERTLALPLRRIVLLCHLIVPALSRGTRRQHGQRGSVLTRVIVRRRRMEVIEAATRGAQAG